MTLPDQATYSPQGSAQRLSTLISWLVIFGFVGFVAYSQWRSAQRAAVAAVRSSTSTNFTLEMTARIAVTQADLASADQSPSGRTRQANLAKQLRQNLDKMAVSPLDKLKSAVVFWELQGNQGALSALENCRNNIQGSQALTDDANTLQSLYAVGPQSLDAKARKRLVADLGWFGQLAVTQGKLQSDPDRMAVLASAKNTFLADIAVGIAALGAASLGFFLLIFLIVLFALGKLTWNFHPQASSTIFQRKPVLLETFALWALAYLLLSFSLRHLNSTRHLLLFECLLLMISFVIALWPRLRGATWSELSQAMGWHLGAGLFTEIGAGLLGYIAGLPVLAIALFITLLLAKLGHVNPSHPIQQQFFKGMPWTNIVQLLAVAAIAAPLLEETLFRGALYGHLRRRWRPWVSAGMVSLLFAAIHPQGWAGIPLLASIAIVLAMLREWRGSLIASVTAHSLNNAIGVLVMVMLVR